MKNNSTHFLIKLVAGKNGFMNEKLIMLKRWFYFLVMASFLIISLSACEELIDPEQALIVKNENLYEDWEEYRSAEMGLYALQQELVEQLVILGDLRGDLLKVTDNATPDLVDIQNFEIRKDNPYASPVNFYKLISACDKFINQLESDHPEVLDKSADITNYDRLYGEALCMRAWTYFYAVRIYGKVPYIYKSLSEGDEIDEYINTGFEVVDSVYIDYAPDGYYNDTIRDTTIVYEDKLLDQQAIIDTFTHQLETKIKAVGVNHYINNNDLTWQVTIWNDYARHVLLGQMYLYEGDYTKAMEHFDPILYDETSETQNIRYGLDDKFEGSRWQNIFTGIDHYEHIYTLWYGKSFKQTHELQNLFSILPPNEYMMQPTASCIGYWETIFRGITISRDQTNPKETELNSPGIPGDFNRGYGVSYKYYKNNREMTQDTIQEMLLKKRSGNNIDVKILMDGVDTVATKYSIGKDEFAHDANFIVYRAADVHLYAAEIYILWKYVFGGTPVPKENTNMANLLLNTGYYRSNEDQLGVRGRVGFGEGYDAIQFTKVIYKHDPNTNRILGYRELTGEQQKRYLAEEVLKERARELAFKGERFYDLMRVAKAFNDPELLADKVAAKFPSGQRGAIKQKLMDERNWYINYFE